MREIPEISPSFTQNLILRRTVYLYAVEATCRWNRESKRAWCRRFWIGEFVSCKCCFGACHVESLPRATISFGGKIYDCEYTTQQLVESIFMDTLLAISWKEILLAKFQIVPVKLKLSCMNYFWYFWQFSRGKTLE